ncbi:MAG: sigma-70 family RNA polymerase sigma factor [Bacteroidales bacterium]|nr:sigma-70 family RNA polymerase sigma factor [Bacteroidales bacterium]
MTAKEYNNCTRLWADDVMRFAVRLSTDRADCEDAVQDAFAAMWKHRDKVSVDKGKSFLISVAYRRLMSTFRRHKADERYIQTIRTSQQEPDTSFDIKEAIERSLQALPETQRAIMQLRDVEGYSYREISETLELSEEKVQVYLFRARVAMRKQLITMGYDEYKQ